MEWSCQGWDRQLLYEVHRGSLVRVCLVSDLLLILTVVQLLTEDMLMFCVLELDSND